MYSWIQGELHLGILLTFLFYASYSTQKRDAIKKKLDEKPAVQKFKEIQKRAGEKRKAAARKISRTKAAVRAAGRRVNQGGNVVLSPVRFVGRVFHFFGGGLGRIRLFCMAVAGACVVFFLLLVVLVDAVLSACRTEAETAVSGSPEASYVHGGRQIIRYGCPDGEGGWTAEGKVVYVDGNGNRQLLGANNIKDAVVVSYLFMDAGFDGHEAVRDALVLDVWQMMNPDLVFEESEIYTCPGGCETYHYSCDSQSDLSEIERLKADGVVFLGDLEECGQEPGETQAEDTEAEDTREETEQEVL